MLKRILAHNICDFDMPQKNISPKKIAQEIGRDIEPIEIVSEGAPVNLQDTMIVSSDEDFLKKYSDKGYAVLAVSSQNKYFDGIKYVTWDILDCNYKYLNEIFCRQRSIPVKILETERTFVVETSKTDLDAMYELYDDDEVRRFVEPLYGRKEEEDYLQKYIEGMYEFYGYGMWSVFSKDGRLVGKIGLNNRNVDGEVCVELGYIVHKAFRRMGLAKEVCHGILKYAKEQLGMSKVYILTEKDNMASVRVAISMGFEELEPIVIEEKIHRRFCKRI